MPIDIKKTFNALVSTLRIPDSLLVPYSIKIPRALLYYSYFADQDRPSFVYNLVLWDITLTMAFLALLLTLKIIPATAVSGLLIDYVATFASVASIMLIFDRMSDLKKMKKTAAKHLQIQLAVLVILFPFYRVV